MASRLRDGIRKKTTADCTYLCHTQHSLSFSLSVPSPTQAGYDSDLTQRSSLRHPFNNIVATHIHTTLSFLNIIVVQYTVNKMSDPKNNLINGFFAPKLVKMGTSFRHLNFSTWLPQPV